MKRHYSEAEKFLRREGIEYSITAQGQIRVAGNIDISERGLTELPDLSNVIVEKGFYCHSNKLESLKGAPLEVHGHFWCEDNQLTTLAGAPAHVGGGFSCERNKLRNLYGAPQSVGTDFWCDENPLQTLEGGPQTFLELVSPFGLFKNVDDIPPQHRYTPETRAAMQAEADALMRRETRARAEAAARVGEQTDLTGKVPRLRFPTRK